MAKGSNSKLGKWNKTEHDRFMKALQKYGKNWTLIQKSVSTRSLAQVRSHAQKLFLSMSKSDLKTLEFELAQRFQSFCNLSKGKSGITEKKMIENTHPIQVMPHEEVKAFDKYFQKIEKCIQNQSIWSEENKQKIVYQESTQKDISSEAPMADNEELLQLNACDNQYMLNMGYFQTPQMGFFFIPQPALAWMHY